jgi:magnesium-protoporphyrin O-methyltransferase
MQRHVRAPVLRHLRSRYRRRGLDRTAARIVDFATSRGIDGATVLEVGGGIGDIQLELLRRGAGHATNLELVGVYDSDAASAR